MFKTPKHQTSGKPNTKKNCQMVPNTPTRTRKGEYQSLKNSYSAQKGRKENGLVELTKKFIELLVGAND